MDRYCPLVLLLLSVVLGGCSHSARSGSGPAHWHMTYVDRKFSFQMPGEPEIESTRQDSPLGEVELHIYTLMLDHGRQRFAFNATELPSAMPEPQGKEIETKLDVAQQGAIDHQQSKLLDSKKIIYKGYAGRDFLAELPNKSITRVRMILMKRRSIWLEVVNVNSKDADRFFESLKLLDESAEPESKPRD